MTTQVFPSVVDVEDVNITNLITHRHTHTHTTHACVRVNVCA